MSSQIMQNCSYLCFFRIIKYYRSPCVESCVCLYQSQNVVRTKKCGMQDASMSLIFLSHFYIFCDLLLNRLTVTWNLFVFYDEKKLLFVLSSVLH